MCHSAKDGYFWNCVEWGLLHRKAKWFLLEHCPDLPNCINSKQILLHKCQGKMSNGKLARPLRQVF